MTSAEKIREIADGVRDLLLEKNKAYGDSALKPANIFAKGSAVENLACRIDDKIMRIKNRGITADTEDTIQDLIGYLILLKIAIENERTQPISYDLPVSHTDGQSPIYNVAVRTHKNLDWWETPSSSSTSKVGSERSEEKASGDPMGG
jgi:hypothetical protein